MVTFQQMQRAISLPCKLHRVTYWYNVIRPPMNNLNVGGF